jgi:RNA polymerase sigma-70 factor (ECF subfamily)
MKRVNLKIYYSFIYKTDTFVEIPDKIEKLLKQFHKEEHADYERRRVYHAYYSLDFQDGAKLAYDLIAESPEAIYLQKKEIKTLYEAILCLPARQMKRVYARYFLGISASVIARTENVDESTVRESIHRALNNLNILLNHPPKKPKKSAD